MKYIQSLLALLGLGLILVQCDKREAEVVQFNDKYSVKKPVPAKRDTAPAVDLLNLYARFGSSEEQVIVALQEQNGASVVGNKPEASLNITTSFLAPEDVSFKLSIDAATGASSGKTLLPEAAIRLPENLKVVKGTQELEAKITFDSEILKTLEVGNTYYFYVRLSSESAEVRKTNNQDLALVAVTIRSGGIPQGDNISNPSGSVAGMTKSSGGVRFTSDYATSGLHKLTDGRSDNWWVKSGSTTVLTADFGSKKTLKGVYIECSNSSKALGKVKVEVEDDNGKWVGQGIYQTSAYQSQMHIVFKKPVDVQKIRFGDFTALSGVAESFIDINEMAFYF